MKVIDSVMGYAGPLLADKEDAFCRGLEDICGCAEAEWRMIQRAGERYREGRKDGRRSFFFRGGGLF